MIKLSTPKQIEFYRDGLVHFHDMTEAARVWLLANDPQACPAGARLDFLAA